MQIDVPPEAVTSFYKLLYKHALFATGPTPKTRYCQQMMKKNSERSRLWCR